jgi:hypothetical protein
MRWAMAIALTLPVTRAVVLDRIAVVVNGRAIKDSDIEREIRIADYLNGDKLDFSRPARKKAVSRLIDQAIIRREIELARYPEATDDEVNKMLAETIKNRPAPRTYGLTEQQVRQALKWQLTVVRFMSMRFPARAEANTQEDPFTTWLDEQRKSAAIDYREEELK